MSKREDILDGRQFGVWTAKYGLLYTCNAGWVDLGHSLPGRSGKEARYVIKRGLTVEEKKSVALSIFIEVSLRFESLQLFAEWLGIGQSGFSQEDLVSNLIGFYIGLGEISQYSAVKACHPVSIETARRIWDTEGAVGANKNYSFSPALAKQTGSNSTTQCFDECQGQPRKFPRAFTRIKPAPKGHLFRDLHPF